MFEFDAFLNAVASQVSSLFSALVTLLIFHKIMSPKIRFSELIRADDSPNRIRTQYSIKVAKTGIIDLVDVRIMCRLYVKDVFFTGSKMWSTYAIPVTFSESAILGRDERVIYLSIHKSSLAEGKVGGQVRRAVQEKYEYPSITLERVFMLYKQSYLKVDIMANDRFTGVLKVFSSHRYGLWALRQGKWRADSVELILSLN